MNIDVNSFDNDTIYWLSFARSFSSLASGGKMKKSSKLRRKITKTVINHSADEIEPSVKAYLKDCDDDEFFEIIEKCYELTTKKEEEKEHAFFEQFPEFSKLTLSTLFELCQGRYDVNFSEKGNDLLIAFSNEVVSLLTLKDFSTSADLSLLFDCGGISAAKLERDGGGFVLGAFDCEKEADDEVPTAEIHFRTAEAEVKLCKKFAADFVSPGQYLVRRSYSLIELSEKVHLEDEEASLLPLAKELIDLFSDVQESESCSYPLIKKCAEASGYKEIADRLGELETLSGKKLKIKRTLLGVKLQNAPFEGLWRALAQPFFENEKRYPTYDELIGKTEKITAVRAEIERLMREKGYEGEYPNFSKSGELSGLYTISSEMYLKKRNAEFFVSFSEYSCSDGEVGIGLLSGTKIELKKDKKAEATASDIWSCMLVGKDRCRSDNDSFWSSADEPDITAQFPELSNAIDIAVKKAERKKLKKSEKTAGSSFLSTFLMLTAVVAIGVPLIILLLLIVGFIILAFTLGFDEAYRSIFEIPISSWLVEIYAAGEIVALIISLVINRR